MRLVLLVGAIVAALLIPVTSLAPAWIAEATLQEGAGQRHPGDPKLPPAQLSPALGILPLSGEGETAEANGPPSLAKQLLAGVAASAGATLDVQCENGVCVLAGADEDNSNSSDRAPTVRDGSRAQNAGAVNQGQTSLTWEQAREQLAQLGVTEYRLETSGQSGQSRFSCSVLGDDPEPREFQAVAQDELSAVAEVLAQIESFRSDRF